MRRGEQSEPEAPVRRPMPEGESLRRAELLAMDPIAFEKHVMSFFVGGRLEGAAVTKQTGDRGIDGFARHPNGLIVVQCKRYAPEHLVGGPSVLHFSGAMLFHNAWRGYFVATTDFTRDAKEFAAARGDLILVGMDDFVAWSDNPPDFESVVEDQDHLCVAPIAVPSIRR